MEEANPTPAPTVRSIGMKYGLISTSINIVFFLALALTGMNAFDNKWGWVNMVFGIVILVLAQKAFKDEGDGFMSYGQGFGIGFWMALIAVLVGGAFTYCYTAFIDPSVMDTFYEKQMEQMQERGMPDDQIDVAIGWTKKLFWVFYFIFGFIFSLLVPLIVTIFTQKKNPQPEIV